MAVGCCVLPEPPSTCWRVLLHFPDQVHRMGAPSRSYKRFLAWIQGKYRNLDLKPVHLRSICIVAPFVQNSARLEQRNAVPTPWGTQGEDSSLPLLMRVWTAGYTSQTSRSLVQTWISSNTETPWPYQIAKASLEASRFPLRLKSLWAVFRPLLTLSTFLADDVHRKGC